MEFALRRQWAYEKTMARAVRIERSGAWYHITSRAMNAARSCRRKRNARVVHESCELGFDDNGVYTNLPVATFFRIRVDRIPQGWPAPFAIAQRHDVKAGNVRIRSTT